MTSAPIWNQPLLPLMDRQANTVHTWWNIAQHLRKNARTQAKPEGLDVREDSHTDSGMPPPLRDLADMYRGKDSYQRLEEEKKNKTKNFFMDTVSMWWWW